MRTNIVGLIVAAIVLAACASSPTGGSPTTNKAENPPKTTEVVHTIPPEYTSVPEYVSLCNVLNETVLGENTAPRYKNIPNVIVGKWGYVKASLIIKSIDADGNVDGLYVNDKLSEATEHGRVKVNASCVEFNGNMTGNGDYFLLKFTIANGARATYRYPTDPSIPLITGTWSDWKSRGYGKFYPVLEHPWVGN